MKEITKSRDRESERRKIVIYTQKTLTQKVNNMFPGGPVHHNQTAMTVITKSTDTALERRSTCISQKRVRRKKIQDLRSEYHKSNRTRHWCQIRHILSTLDRRYITIKE
jgi:hypothetical protein